MSNTIPSTFQTIVSNEAAAHLAKVLKTDARVILDSKITGIAPGNSDHMPALPESAVEAWAGACAETYRELILSYWKYLGLFPD